MEKKIIKKEWSEFTNTGLLLIVNQLLHIFGWALVIEVENDKIKNVFPARVSYRGFNILDATEAYRKLSRYMLENAEELNKEVNF